MPELRTETIDDVEVMRVGVWRSANAGDVPITEGDLDAMVKAFKATRGEVQVPVKIGHEMRQAVFGDLADEVVDGEPAFGWVDSLHRDGERLVATLSDVPAKLAAFMRVKAWRNRSAEVRFDAVVNGKRWPRMLQAIALLGAIPPAVKGLADLYMTDGGECMQITLAEGMDEADFDGIIAKLDALRDQWEAAISGRRGAPQTRHLFEAFKSDLRRAARLVAKMAEGDDMATLTEALGLPDDSTRADVVATLAEGKAETIAAVVKMAGDITFANAAEFVAWLAGKLDISPSDLSAIAGAVQEALGLETASPDGIEEPPAEPVMSEAQMSDGEAKMAAQLAELQGWKSRTEATRDVDAMIAAGKAVPAQRETLISIRLGSPAQFAEFVKSAPVVVHLGETGTSTSEAEVLTESEIAAHIEGAKARNQAPDLDGLRAWKRSQ